MGFTTSITIIAPATGQACQPIAPVVTGVLWDVTNGLPVIGRLVTLYYNGTVAGTDVTGGAGDYSIPSFYIVDVGAFNLGIVWAGDATYDPVINNSPITMSYCESSAELAVGFFVNPYRTPAAIKTEDGERLWGAILCIDPNGLRPVGPVGPIYYLLDTMTIRPGLSDKSGAFEATINDNKNDNRTYDMTLLTQDSIYIRDNDEFWIGVQQGAEAPNTEAGLDYGWSVADGGRQWLMGGWITKRYYRYDPDSRITASIEGRCYMDLWRRSYFGTAAIPRNYTSPSDFGSIAFNVLTDVNAGQTADYQFSTSGSHWPAAPTGLEWLKEFREESAFKVMQDGCDEIGYEWQIVINPSGATPAARREVQLYQRVFGPIAVQPLIEFDRNIRDAPRIVMGDTTKLTSGVIITGMSETIPPDVSGWIQQGLWPDLSYTNREYTMLSVPYPPNSARIGSGGEFSDASLVIDDEGKAALNLQKTVLGAGQFYCCFNYYTDESGQPKAARMEIDLRQWRRLKFRFKHGTRDTPDLGSAYRIGIHSTGGPGIQFLNSAYKYDFGTGVQQDDPTFVDPTDANLNDPQVSDHDTISDSDWTEIDLLLPEVDPSGATITKHHGWFAVTGGGAPDPTKIDFISIGISPAESEPGNTYAASVPPAFVGRPFIHRVALTTAPTIPSGTRYLDTANPENIFGRGTGTFPTGISGETMFFNPRPYCLIAGRHAGSWHIEPVYIAGINGPDYPSPAYTGAAAATIRLENGLQNTYSSQTYLYIVGGWSISFSQIHFERNILLEKAATSVPLHLQNPKRYRLADYQELEYSSEAEAKADQDLLALGISRQDLRIRVDGDPRQRIGMRVVPRLDPERSDAGEPDMVFQDVPMVIDDVEHRVIGADFVNVFLLGRTTQSRSVGLDSSASEVIDISKQSNRILRNARGTTPLTRGIVQPE